MSRPIQFKPFDPDAEVSIYRTKLPHWRQPGCTYFVTFRLGDALPRQVTCAIHEERVAWLKANGIEFDLEGKWHADFQKLPRETQSNFHREFSAVLDKYLDEGSGSCVLKEPANAGIIRDALLFYDEKRYALGDFVIMPNHVHVLICPFAGQGLEDVLGRIKGFAARQINKATGESGSLWQKDNFDHIVRDRDELIHYQDYIRDNPRKARLRPANISHYEVTYT